MKVCKSCNVEKDKSAFRVSRSNADGRDLRCKDCINKVRKIKVEAKTKERDFYKQFDIV